MEDAEFGSRLRHIRNNILDLTLEKLGNAIGVGKSQLSQVEGGRAKLGPKALLTFIEKYKDKFDVRYLFGQIDNPDLADLRNTGGAATTDNVLKILREQQKQIVELTSLIDKRVASASHITTAEAERIEIDTVLRGLVRKMINLRRPLWEKVDSYIDGMTAIDQDRDLAKEREAASQ